MPDRITSRTRSVAAGQLALELPNALPFLAIEPEWKVQPRLWGHSLHPMCSYLASFPAALAHAFIARYTRPGDVVLDPFSGRGTAPLQAAAEGRIGVGNDLNPLAAVLTAAKLDPATPAESRTRLATLQLAWAADAPSWLALADRVKTRPGHPSAFVPAAGSGDGPDTRTESVPDEVALAFHPRTLAQVLLLRSHLDTGARPDRFLLGAMSGILHGKTGSYLSTIMPNTFSMAPRYVRGYVAATGYEPPERDAFEALAAKLDRLYRQPLPTTAGIALQGDARTAGGRARAALRAHGLPDRARLVVTSPPYLRVLKYGYYNWLRTWLLGFDPAAIDADLDAAHRSEPYLAFLREVLADLRSALTDDGIAVLVIGDVEMDRGKPSSDGVGLAQRVWEEAALPAGYRLAGVVRDDVAANRKMTRLWGEQAGRATKTDRILVMGASEAGRRRALATADLPIDWNWPLSRLRAIPG
jgi:site-specific DNA-methyltransferase (adenine-specific)